MNGLEKGIDFVGRILNTATITYLGVDTRDSFNQLYYRFKKIQAVLATKRSGNFQLRATQNNDEMER